MAERFKLIFLAFTIALAQFAALSMKDDVGELVVTFTAIELNQDAAPAAFIVDEAQQLEGLDEPAESLQGASETGWPVVGLECPGTLCAFREPKLANVVF